MIYIIDTSALIHDPDLVFNSFKGRDIIIPIAVVRELDKHKTRQEHPGRAARKVLRNIYDIRNESPGGVNEKWDRPCGGTLLVELNHESLHVDLESKIANIGQGFTDSNDDKILTVALNFSHELDDDVILITNDLAMSVKASASGIKNERHQTRAEKFTLGKGIKTISPQGDEIEKLMNGNPVFLDEETAKSLPTNTGVIVSSGSTSGLGISNGESILPIDKNVELCGVNPRGAEQIIAANLMTGNHAGRNRENPHEFFGSLSGRAGSGKTFLAIAAGLEMVKRGEYNKVRVFRPTVAPSKNSNIGFLPGNEEEKMAPWRAAINTVLENMGVEDEHYKNSEGFSTSLSEKVTIETLNFIRGQGYHNDFIIIDEAQNLEVHELITALTRVGSGSCVVITWDPSQIDNPYIKNGLAEGPIEALMRTMPNDIVWHVEFEKSRRGGVSALF